ncbi:hypothetical protein NDU88_000251 [Pleurodeles waltl]|uniref:Uncharacterized protein n=1 Tax=Pleurodeles waltl TaxID=8319 RepID=A0AAV7UQ87_PLEWA|nr:hypothetical protein NDU88_000251 [Pleurodeles waltl]
MIPVIFPPDRSEVPFASSLQLPAPAIVRCRLGIITFPTKTARRAQRLRARALGGWSTPLTSEAGGSSGWRCWSWCGARVELPAAPPLGAGIPGPVDGSGETCASGGTCAASLGTAGEVS